MPCRTRRTAVEALCAARPDPGASPDIRVTATESPARFSSPCRCAVVDVRSGQKLQLCTARPFRSVVRWSGRSEAPALHGRSSLRRRPVVWFRSSSSAWPVLSTSKCGGRGGQKLQLCMTRSFPVGGAVVGDFRSSSSARCVLSLVRRFTVVRRSVRSAARAGRLAAPPGGGARPAAPRCAGRTTGVGNGQWAHHLR
jgi:hypothetical protein